MTSINEKIATKLKQIRNSRGLSLEQVAELTGVSKAMLGQIERGASNPTVTTLWKIATGLKVSFSSFVEEEEPDVSVVSLSNITPIIEAEGDYKVYPIFPFKQEKQFEIYMIFLGASGRHESEAHQAGVEEYITVLEGELELQIGDQSYTICEGEAVRFHADKPHVYINRQPTPLRFQNLIYYRE